MNPFTPGHTVDPQFFAGRKKEIEKFKMFLKNTYQGNPMNMAILGERGIGKSSLLRTCENLARTERCIVVRVDLDAAISTINDLVITILQEIKQEGGAYSKIVEASQGHPYIIQLFGFYLCEKAASQLIDGNTYKATLPMIMDGLSKQLFEDYYHTSSPLEQKILRAIAEEKEFVLDFSLIVKKVKQPPNKVSNLLNRLCEKDCLKKVSRGHYRLFHNLFRDYLRGEAAA